MPPSGFTERNTAGIRMFLTSCFLDWRSENIKVRKPEVALDREIRNIEHDLARNKRSPVQEAILLLAKEFYVRLRKKVLPRSGYAPLDVITNEIIAEICDETERIKIVETK